MTAILVTGAAGFIGTNFVRYWREHHPDDHVVALDALTYAGVRENVDGLDGVTFVARRHRRHRRRRRRAASSTTSIVIVNFAAESHNSLAVLDPARFFRTNVLGTQGLCEAARRVGVRRFHHVSTCEVYGDLALDTDEKFTEDVAVPAAHAVQRLEGRRRPRRAGLPRDVGPAGDDHQLRQQLRPVPVPGEGDPVLHDAGARATSRCRCTRRRRTGGSGSTPSTTAGRSTRSSTAAGSARPTTSAPVSSGASSRSPTRSSTTSASRASLKTIVPDRPGHDRRYVLDWSKIHAELGWEPEIDWDAGIAETIDWYAGQPAVVAAAARPGAGRRGHRRGSP